MIPICVKTGFIIDISEIIMDIGIVKMIMTKYVPRVKNTVCLKCEKILPNEKLDFRCRLTLAISLKKMLPAARPMTIQINHTTISVEKLGSSIAVVCPNGLMFIPRPAIKLGMPIGNVLIELSRFRRSKVSNHSVWLL